MILLMCKK